jgi:DNA polymerase
MTKQQQLDSIAQQILDNSVTPELAATATQLVMGGGSPNADVVFIGEAPGAKEDQLGQPFVGAAGKFLDEMLASIAMDRSSVYITNIVKYRPPANRDPLPAEIEAFKPYLYQQLEVIAPKLVVFLGRHAMSVFLPELKISQAHGRIYRKDNLTYMPLYHPAAALYNGGLRGQLLEDFAGIPKVISKL